jgi:hypothetical protein
MLENSENILEINPIVLAFLIYFIVGIFFTPIAKKHILFPNLETSTAQK